MKATHIWHCYEQPSHLEPQLEESRPWLLMRILCIIRLTPGHRKFCLTNSCGCSAMEVPNSSVEGYEKCTAEADTNANLYLCLWGWPGFTASTRRCRGCGIAFLSGRRGSRCRAGIACSDVKVMAYKPAVVVVRIRYHEITNICRCWISHWTDGPAIRRIPLFSAYDHQSGYGRNRGDVAVRTYLEFLRLD